MLFEHLFLGSFGSAVSRDDVHHNAKRRRRIRTGSKPTSVINEYGMVLMTTVATITEGITITRLCNVFLYFATMKKCQFSDE